MAKHLIIAEFHDYGAAHRAFCELLRCDVQPDDITLIAGDQADQLGASRDFGLLAEDAGFYTAAVRRGATLLAVQVHAAEGPTVAEIIQDHGAKDVEAEHACGGEFAAVKSAKIR